MGRDITGELAMTYDLYSIDPNSASFNPTLDTISTDDSLKAAAEIEVLGTPEPSGWLGTVGALGIPGLVKRRIGPIPRCVSGKV